MSGDRAEQIALATARAKGAIGAANRQAERIREAADQLLVAGSKLAATGSEVLGGVLGGSLFAIAGLVLSPWSPILIPAIPLIGVAGICAGVLAVRGPSGVRRDRERRNRLLDEAQALEAARNYREEVHAAIANGAPDAVELWAGYGRRLSEPVSYAQRQIGSGALDSQAASRQLPPASEVPALSSANPAPAADG